MTLLVVEQNVRMALLLAEYGYVIKDGVIHIEGPAEQMITDDAVRLSYLGGNGRRPRPEDDAMSAAGPSQGRPRERGEAQARRARPRAWMAADTRRLRVPAGYKEAAANRSGRREAPREHP